MKKTFATMVICSFYALHGHAWEGHGPFTYLALNQLEEIKQLPAVQVESLDSFLRNTKNKLGLILENQESWAKNNIAEYPARPLNLQFNAQMVGPELRSQFSQSLRINPNVLWSLHLQKYVGPLGQREDASDGASFPAMTAQMVTLFASTDFHGPQFLRLKEGNQVYPLDIVASASDEPDYGADVGVWEDSGTDFGASYGFGKQPFGNPAVAFSGQAPFHMGFYFESPIIYKAASFLKRTYPEYRIHLYLTLSHFAFQNEHPYWGWRFLGNALHYLQDLTQPYHSTVVPGATVKQLLWINTLDAIGVHRPKNERVQLMTNRHFVIEEMASQILEREMEDGELNSYHLLRLSLIDEAYDASYPEYSDSYPRKVVAQESHALSTMTDLWVSSRFPERLVNDPTYLFGTTEAQVDLLKVVGGSGQLLSIKQQLALLMNHLGAHTRNFVRSAREK